MIGNRRLRELSCISLMASYFKPHGLWLSIDTPKCICLLSSECIIIKINSVFYRGKQKVLLASWFIVSKATQLHKTGYICLKQGQTKRNIKWIMQHVRHLRGTLLYINTLKLYSTYCSVSNLTMSSYFYGKKSM